MIANNKKANHLKVKWLYYQDVESLNMYIEPTEKDKKDGEDFRKFIDEKKKRRR